MRVKLWGDRGSIPVPGNDTKKYGGNTASLEVEFDADHRFFIDAGTGIRDLGNQLVKEGYDKEINLFISHTHWDHIIGFPFFTPIYFPGKKINIYGPVHYEKRLQDIFAILMDYSYFPISAAQLSAEVKYIDLKETSFELNGVKITTKYLNHPVLNLGYRFEYEGKVFVYTGDHEKYYNVFGDNLPEEEAEDLSETIQIQNDSVVEFVNGADIFVADTTYTDEEYTVHIGWGHSSVGQTIELCKNANVKLGILTHHDPAHSDALVDELAEKYESDSIKFAVEKKDYYA